MREYRIKIFGRTNPLSAIYEYAQTQIRSESYSGGKYVICEVES